MGITAFERVFGVRSLNGAPVEKYAEDTFGGHFQDKFTMHGRNHGADMDKNTVEFDVISYPKDAAPITDRDAPATLEKPTDRQNKISFLAYIKLKKFLPASRVFGSRGPGELKSNAAAVVAAEQKASLKRINTTREVMAAKVLQGSFDASAVGSDVSFTLDFPVATRTAATTWANAGTDLIADEIPLTKSAYYDSCRMEAKQVIVDRNTRGYIRKNTSIQTFLAPPGIKGSAVAFASDRIVGPAVDNWQLNGLDWQVNEAGYDLGGALTRYLPADKSIWLPGDDELDNVLGYAEGWGDIPKQAIGNGAGVIGKAPQPGVFSYATCEESPVGINLYTGWVGLFFVTFPEAVLLLTSKI